MTLARFVARIGVKTNMTENNSGCSLSFGGIGFSGILTIVFIVLKLTDVISWDWVWVLAPAWISLSISLVLFVIAAVIKLILHCLER